MNKTQWLDWVEASTERLQQRYREAWNRARRRPSRLPPLEEPKRWSAIQPEIDREAREVVVHLELPEPHTSEAAVRVIGSTLSIAVLITGTDIRRAPAEDFYRRAIPLPPRVDPDSAVHKVHGSELVIRLQPAAARRQPSRAKSAATQRKRRKPTQTAKTKGSNVTQIKRPRRVQPVTA